MGSSVPAGSALLAKQGEWLVGFRSRLLRRAGVAHRRWLLDLGCGPGLMLPELQRRSGGRVVGVDRDWHVLRPLAALARPEATFPRSLPICADACRLPFAEGSFDLVFCQWVLLWMPLPAVLEEIRRVLGPRGVLVALEPDYGGMIEYPPAVASADLWRVGLKRAGADPEVGRKLPTLLTQLGFEVEVMLLDRLVGPDPARWEMLAELPLTPAESARLQEAREAESQVPKLSLAVHLPIFGIYAQRK